MAFPRGLVVPSAHRQIIRKNSRHSVKFDERGHPVEAVQADVEELLAVRRPDPQAWACDVLVGDISVFNKKLLDQIIQRVEICSSAGFVVWSDPRHASVRHTQQLRRILINFHCHNDFNAGRSVLYVQDLII